MTVEMMEIDYNRARSLAEKDDINSLEEAVKIFEDLKDYKESMKLRDLTVIKLNEKKGEIAELNEEKYDRAVMLMQNKKSAQRLDQAIKLFSELEDYKDSNELKEKCLQYRQTVMKKDKNNIEKMRLVGYLCAGIGVIVIAFIILAIIYNIMTNGGEG